MGESVRVRAGTAGDVEEVLAFWRHAAEGTDRKDSAAAVYRLVERDPEALMLAELDGRLVGTLIAGWDGWRCHLYRLAVDPAHRRQGIARTLLAAAERRFTEAGGIRADAMVLHDNTIAHPAWVAAGYTYQPQWGRWVKPLTV
ncbi:N-acetyltransferase [Sphaerisporangium rufum]|uniref:N-acetyltransferase n=1 Tax=Sphaerisporangium rufum TaxID=1381558 RepID=A0A919V328_9ACTN|nr:GNAT family N-acetyltransferase [Sphaerisporangium rufum]GII79618.1 N-acetyltransferase [Sphaerisporangium rufum]